MPTWKGRLRSSALLLLAVLPALAACSQQPGGPAPAAHAPSAPTEAPERPYADVILPRGPFFSPPLHEGFVPGGAVPELVMPLATEDQVEMKALLLSATRNESEQEPSTGAWLALLEQAGVPYDWFIVTEREPLTREHLVREDGVGRYQAILLSTSNLVYQVGESWPSAMTSEEWSHLFQYELEYGVRQATLYAAPFATPEDLGVTPLTATHASLDGVALTATAAGLEIFTDLAPDSEIQLYGTTGFPSTDPVPGATPLLMSGTDILAVHVETGGRERVAMLFNNPAWGTSNTPAIYSQQLGPSLLRWALGGVHLGEKRNSYQADVDDWFNSTGLWDVSSGQDHETDEFAMTGQDAFSAAAQQRALRAVGGGIAPDFRWSMAYNGYAAQPESQVDCALPPSQHTLSSMTRCLKGEFWWVNHTWTHAYMDWNPPHVAPDHDTIMDEIQLNDQLSLEFGFGDNDSRRSLVTGDISGLGWYSPGGPDSGPKVDHGLGESNPYLLSALVASGHRYLASNMSTHSHEPDCWACGMVHPLNAGVFLVPRWPTNLFASVTTPASVVQAYNMIYGPGGSNPIEEIEAPLTYEQILDIDTDIALVHLLSGSPYPHYFHIANLHEYTPGRSTLFDWTEALFEKYAGFVHEPILSYRNDDFGDYVHARTEYLESGVAGVWDRSTGQMTITAANGGPVFLTGASLGGGATDLIYNGRLISERTFAPGEEVVTTVTSPAVRPAATISATPATIDAGSSATLSWSVSGDATGTSIREQDASEPLVTGLPTAGTLTVSPEATTTYELVMTWPGGIPVVASTTVTVVPEPEPEPARYTLTLDISGAGLGVVISSPLGISCLADCSADFPEGTVITLTSVPLLGSTFETFTGACTQESCTITIDRDLAVGAIFRLEDR